MRGLKMVLPLVLATACAGPAQSGSGVALACGPASDATARVCAQMRGVMAEAAPNRRIEEVAFATAPEAQQPLVRLYLDKMAPDRISAHLEWHLPDSGWQTGEMLSMDVMDARLNDAMISRFLASLWTRSGIRL